jgi:protein-serine/threonine kinase
MSKVEREIEVLRVRLSFVGSKSFLSWFSSA